MSQSKIVMIGAGHLGSLLLKGWLKKKLIPQSKLHLHVKTQKSAKALKKKYPKLSVGSDEKGNPIPEADIFVIAVKPQQWSELKPALQKSIKKKTLLLSIMAGIPPSRLEKETGAKSIVAMTNTCLQAEEALTSIFKSPSCSKGDLKKALKLFKNFGMLKVLEEKNFAAATVCGGSHPAFAIWILGELAKIISAKLPSENGMEWTLQVFKGAEKLIKKNNDIPYLLSQIATPAGCTAVGLKALEEQDVAGRLKEVFDQCQRKAESLVG